MILVTGGAGFIGSTIIAALNASSRYDILVVDNLGTSAKWKNLVGLRYAEYIHKDDFRELLSLTGELPWEISAIIHMGACSSTSEENMDYLFENNVEFSKMLALYAREKNIRMVYASSAATYGDGSQGFSDHSEPFSLTPMNRYGYSKNFFDGWVQEQGLFPSLVGLKFFNVYGPNEYHKGSMISMVYRAYQQVKEHNLISLFRSYDSNYKDGEQKRDFVYVKDCATVAIELVTQTNKGGLLNVGTGNARTWNDLAHAVFSACKTNAHNIQYIDMPESLRNQYQYYTAADIKKHDSLLPAHATFSSLENGVTDYVCNYLSKESPYLTAKNYSITQNN